MNRQRLQFLGLVLLFTLLWLCVRFPFQVATLAAKFLASPDEVDPLRLHLRGELVESNLGTDFEPDGSVTVRLIAQQFNFVPSCVPLPAGRPVRFRITSADVVHRLTIAGTKDSIEVVPGHVNESRLQFDRPGEYATPCHEFCGAGHYNMRSRIRVVSADQFPKPPAPGERLTCDSP
jgi:cytochrome c oxidase subunit 2